MGNRPKTNFNAYVSWFPCSYHKILLTRKLLTLLVNKQFLFMVENAIYLNKYSKTENNVKEKWKVRKVMVLKELYLFLQYVKNFLTCGSRVNYKCQCNHRTIYSTHIYVQYFSIKRQPLHTIWPRRVLEETGCTQLYILMNEVDSGLLQVYHLCSYFPHVFPHWLIALAGLSIWNIFLFLTFVLSGLQG